MAGTTNDDKPFEPGETIIFAGDLYEVVENFGHNGTVKEKGDHSTFSFYWTFQGEKCRRAESPQ